MSFIARILLIASLLLPYSLAWSWDATGHRLSAYVAWEFLDEDLRSQAITILQAHPRYQQDFLDAMPVSALVGDEAAQARWLFGQAAIWPDLIRNNEIPENLQYSRPDWHWIDGRWVRNGIEQGNVYVGLVNLSDIDGERRAQIEAETDARNIMTAIDWNLSVLSSRLSTRAEKAVALSWMLHLIGDIHQPLHAGALVSRERFPDGDRGGNGIPTAGGNLHAIWDQALRSQPFDDTLSRLIAASRQTPLSTVILESELWLSESRSLLQNTVYNEEIKAAVLRSERKNQRLRNLSLDEDYNSRMRAVAEDRLSSAALRIAAQLRSSLAK
ncbi:MAG: S1/P1 nuclease [Pseudohongiellaceae bacterium]|nr:S1/P1 nuclease [Pseudohongiellaceae bacterium]